MEKYSLVLLAAGRGTRFGGDLPKQYLNIGGKPIIVHCLESINAVHSIDEIICVCDLSFRETIAQYCEQYGIKKKIKFISGGLSRQQDVYNGIIRTSNDNIILHEAARPFVSAEDFEVLISHPAENITYGYDLLNSVMVKNKENMISGVIEREKLINIQLPQKFKKQDLLFSHEQAIKEKKCFSEDSGLVFYYTHKPVICLTGKLYNIKITVPIDLIFGEVIYKELFLSEINK